MLERRDVGAVEGLSPRRTEVLWRLAVVRLLKEPRCWPGDLSGCFSCAAAPRLVLEMGTTRLMLWFSVLVRVRTGLPLLGLFGGGGLIPAGRLLEVVMFLVFVGFFPLVIRAAPPTAGQEAAWFPVLSSADCPATVFLAAF